MAVKAGADAPFSQGPGRVTITESNGDKVDIAYQTVEALPEQLFAISSIQVRASRLRAQYEEILGTNVTSGTLGLPLAQYEVPGTDVVVWSFQAGGTEALVILHRPFDTPLPGATPIFREQDYPCRYSHRTQIAKQKQWGCCPQFGTAIH